MLDRAGAGADRTLDALGAVRVRRHERPVQRGLVHRRTDLVFAELRRARRGPPRQHRAGGDDLDEVGAPVEDLADHAPDLVGGVRHPEPELSRDLDVGRHRRDVAATARDGHVGAGALHPGPDDRSFVDGLAEGHVHERPECPDVTHGGEPGHHRVARVANARECLLRARPHEQRGVLAPFEFPHQVRVAVDEARHDSVLRQVDHPSAVRISALVRSHRLDAVADDLDDLSAEELACGRVDQAAGAYDGQSFSGHGPRA